MVSIKDSLDKLELYLLELEEKYIDTHDDPLEDPDKYKLDVRSYCVLSHAAFEEFVENICLYTLNEIEDKFINTQRISYSTLCLLHFNGNTKTIDDDSWDDNDRIYDYLLGQIKSIKSEFSRYIMNQNHGVGLKYLKKLLQLRIFEDENGKTNRSLMDIGGQLLLVSQFTLYANCRHGNRPSFTDAGDPQRAEQLYEYMIEKAKEQVPVVETGIFGADMKVSLINDGPFTILLDDAAFA